MAMAASQSAITAAAVAGTSSSAAAAAPSRSSSCSSLASLPSVASSVAAASSSSASTCVLTTSTLKLLDEFVIDQLIDNGMDTIASRINRLYDKLRHSSKHKKTVKYAKRLQHLLFLGLQLLQHQRAQYNRCIHTLEQLQEPQPSLRPTQMSKKPVKVLTPPSRSSSRSKASSLVRQPATILPLNCHVAAKIARSHELWILARVVKYYESSDSYEVEDVDCSLEEGEQEREHDDESNGSANTKAQALTVSGGEHTGKRHHVVASQHIVQLPAESLSSTEWRKFAAKDHVMALYPNTTSFYAAVVQIPNPVGSPFVVVKFDDDYDEIGGAPNRKIPFRFVAPMPSNKP